MVLSTLTGGSRVKPLAMVELGVTLSTVGMNPLGGTVRFTFDAAGAQAELSFIAVTAGLFGVAEVLALTAAPAAAGAATRVRFRELYPSPEELRRSVPPMLRGTVLGFLVGLVPGPAATIASFVSDGVEKRARGTGTSWARAPSRTSPGRRRPTTPPPEEAWCHSSPSACPSRWPRRRR